jgi:hypothetical protein
MKLTLSIDTNSKEQLLLTALLLSSQGDHDSEAYYEIEDQLRTLTGKDIDQLSREAVYYIHSWFREVC